MRIRPANEQDSADLLAWRNDSATRAASLNQDRVAEADHLAWLARTLADPDRVLLIVEDREKLGMVRFDAGADGWAVSINLAPGARGRGLSRPILAAAMDRLAAERGARAFTAEVRETNAASLRLFQALGFEDYVGSDGVRRMRRIEGES